MPRLVAVAAALVTAAAAAGSTVLPAAGCNGTGVTPVCTHADGAIDPEAGCGTPVEASAGDATSASNEAGDDDATPPATDAGGEDASQDAADASVIDAALHDAAIEDAHSDSKG